MWPRIIAKYPEAHLDLFCDTQNEWCQKHWGNDMVEVDRMLLEYKNTVTNHGWVNGETLRGFWAKAHVWFYPCTFEETCCLTAWEAAASKTLVVSNNLAALKTSIGNRGVIVEGNAREKWWHDQALERMFEVLDNEAEHEYTDRNFEWVKTKNFETVVGDFVHKYIE
jgi:glycogen synthase